MAAIGGLPIAAAVDAFTGHLRPVSADSSTSDLRLLMVGDSLTVGSKPYQASAFTDVAWADVAIDAHGSRGIKTKLSEDPHTGLTAVDALRNAHGDADLWVVALGTNDAGQYSVERYPELISMMLDRIGPEHLTMWVNVYMPSRARSQTAWNSALNEVAEQRPAELVIYDWATYAASHDGWLSSDSIHYTGTGYRQRSAAVAAASADVRRRLIGSQRTTDDAPTVRTITAPAGFQPIRAVRILDTRSDGSRLRAGERRSIALSQLVPSEATVVAVNLTAVNAVAPGFITAGPLTSVPPTVSSINFGIADAIAGHAIAALSTDTTLEVFSSTETDLVVDLFGWYAPEAPLGLVLPVSQRLIDTRSTAPTAAAGSTITIEVPTTFGEAAPKAAILNITATDQTTSGFITVWPTDEPMPTVSCLNYTVGAPAASNLVQVALDVNGRASLYRSGQTAVVVDLIAAYEQSADSLRYQAVEPARLLDTRSGRGGWFGPTARDQAIDVPVPDAEVVAVGVLTATAARREGWLATHPGTAALNLSTRRAVSNVVLGTPTVDGRIAVPQGGGGGEHVLFDLLGWFVADAR